MPPTVPDLDDVATLIREVARVEIMPRFENLDTGERWRKNEGSVVTAADIASEKFLAARLPRLVPQSVVVGEEMTAASSDVLDRFEDDLPVWVIDPVDGTSNFAAGNADFAVMVALVVRRETVAGWIYLPVRDAMYVAEKGAGAFRNGERLGLPAAPKELSAMTGSLGGWLRRKSGLPERFVRITATKCIGVDYCALADGDTDFAHYYGTWPWDHAAGILIHGEAGGFNACLDGTPWRAGLPSGGGGILLAPDRTVWDTVQDMIAGAMERREEFRAAAGRQQGRGSSQRSDGT